MIPVINETKSHVFKKGEEKRKFQKSHQKNNFEHMKTKSSQLKTQVNGLKLMRVGDKITKRTKAMEKNQRSANT